MSGLISIFIIALVVEAIFLIGHKAISTWLVSLYHRLNPPIGDSHLHKLKQDIISLKSHLLRTNPKEEFAKWAKTRRLLDKQASIYEDELAKSRREVGKQEWLAAALVRGGVWVVVAAVIGLGRSTGVMWLDVTWFGPVTGVLGLPGAPVGMVSGLIWFLCCRTFAKSTFSLFFHNAGNSRLRPPPSSTNGKAHGIERAKAGPGLVQSSGEPQRGREMKQKET